MEYYVKRSKELVDIWKQFERLDYAIRNVASAKENHPYFVIALYDSIGQKYFEAQGKIKKNIKLLTLEAKTIASGAQAVGTIPSGQQAK